VHYGKTTQERVQDCLAYRKRGYRAVKLRLSENTVDADLVTVEAVANALGDSMQIMVDANQASRKIGDARTWDLDRALETARRLGEFGVVWLEEPLTREFPVEVHSELAERATTPIAGGEGLRGHNAFWEVCTKKLYNIVQPDPVVSGPISTLLEVARMCQAADLPFAYHHGKGGVGMLVALHLQAAFGMGDHLEVMDDPGHWNPEGFQVGFRTPVLPDLDGYVVCPSAPGLGADWDPEWLEEYGLI
jgi:D-galactarolactone cycloisomerase